MILTRILALFGGRIFRFFKIIPLKSYEVQNDIKKNEIFQYFWMNFCKSIVIIWYVISNLYLKEYLYILSWIIHSTDSSPTKIFLFCKNKTESNKRMPRIKPKFINKFRAELPLQFQFFLSCIGTRFVKHKQIQQSWYNHQPQ